MVAKKKKLIVNPDSLLLKRGLSKTAARRAILRLLLERKTAVSGPNLEAELTDICDRSTIYRNLNALTESGLVHRIHLNGESRYKLHPALFDESHGVDHPHFECMQCGKLFCLHNAKVGEPDLPEGFVGEEISYVIYGYCKQCKVV